MVKKAVPKLSIGLPVYNGAKYLKAAIETHLAQSFKDFELIICDNASIDETGNICQHYVSSDQRVRYYRNSENHGAVWNFNRCFELARGEYFKLSAHDDLLEPTFCEKCIEVLDANPDVVLCHSLSKVVDDNLNCLAVYDPSVLATDKPKATRRFGARLRGGRCIEVFGVIRSSALRSVRPFLPFVGCDRALLAELAVEGRFATVQEYLFLNGEHPQRSTQLGLRQLQRLGFYPVKNGAKMHPVRSLFRAYGDIVRRKFPSRVDRIRCYGHMTRALFVRFNILRLMVEPLGSITPWLYDAVKERRRALGWTGYRNVRPGNPIKIK
jgi:glycosyltransferase involved in cell wall biosynthesis